MNYQTYTPSEDLSAFIKCHWTLEVPAEMSGTRQRILPDGCIDVAFIFGDDVLRVLPNGSGIPQPRAMVLGQITEAFDVEPTGHVDSFAVRFYPHGFGCFVCTPLKAFANKETPLEHVFGDEETTRLQHALVRAKDTAERIAIAEGFFRERLTHASTIDHVVRETVDLMLRTKGATSVDSLVNGSRSNQRDLERRFNSKVGVSPKQLAKVIRLQAALQEMAGGQHDNLTSVAYECEYYDQAHFIKDFKEFSGVSPKEYLGSDLMALSSLLYRNP